jgi:CheY-like chemotaxis protein
LEPAKSPQMMNKNPIIVIDDDDEDLDLLKDAFSELNVENEIIYFNDGLKFLHFLKTTRNKTFFILCDINMAKISGLELKQMIYDDEILRLKCLPFIFLSTSKASDAIMKAYSFGVQGFFIKPNNYELLKQSLKCIIDYWSFSQHPNS